MKKATQCGSYNIFNK